MKKAVPCLIILLMVFNTGRANAMLSPPDSNKLIQIPVSGDKVLNTGEVFISPCIGYGDMAIAGSPIANSIFIGTNYYTKFFTSTISPEYGCMIDYMVSQMFGVGLGINYESINFNNTYPTQSYYQNDYYPSTVQFTRYNIGVRNFFYFPSKNSDVIHFYLGARLGLSLWYEKDEWNNGYTGQYYPLIDGTNDSKFSFQLIWGARYFITSDIGIQLELAYGTPYYAQGGITIKLNDKPATYSVTRAEYRAMNEGNQLTHHDSVNLGLLPQRGMKK
jgi:hypothetical protein